MKDDLTEDNSMISLENVQDQVANANNNANNFVSWNDLDNMREEDEIEYHKKRRPSRLVLNKNLT